MLSKHYVLIVKNREIIQYRGPDEPQNENEFKAKPADAVVVQRWPLGRLEWGWKTDFRFKW